MKQSHFIAFVGYAPAPAIGVPNPELPDGEAKLFVTHQGPDDEPDEQAQIKAEAYVRTQFANAKPDQHIVGLRVVKVSAADYETQRIMNLSKGKKTL